MKIIKGFLLLFIGIAVGSLFWLTLFKDAHFFRRELSLEERKGLAVGVVSPLQEPIRVEFKNPKNACVRIESAELDSSNLLVYYRNTCSADIEFLRFQWNGVSPDGTILFSQFTYATDVPAGARGELHYEFVEKDPRTATLVLKANK